MHKTYPIVAAAMKNTFITPEKYREWYQASITTPEKFWAVQAKQFLHWDTPWHTVLSGCLATLDVRWFSGATLNASYNCLDRHLATKGNQKALLWEGDNPNHQQSLTYYELHDRVCRFANVLKSLHIKKGDRVCIYLPMIPEVVIAMLACARIGAVHSVVFAGFSATALKARILDADCKLVITANVAYRAGKVLALKENVDVALQDCPRVESVIVVNRSQQHSVHLEAGRDHWYHNLLVHAAAVCKPEPMDANHPLFILYTSGSTGAPKGILHGTGGYLLYAAITHKYVFDYHPGDIYWCTADVGWVTGHTYVVYGPLLNGATQVLFEGVPSYPTVARFWEIIDKYQVNIFYTAPTAIRALRSEGNHWLRTTRRTSLRVLGTVGEPINPEAWEWYYHKVGLGHCPVVDTWWQTETGGIMISPLPGASVLKPGAAAWPFFGVAAQIVDEAGQPVVQGEMGRLVITQPWPGMLQTVYGKKERFAQYFTEVPGVYLTGDQAHQDSDGFYYIAGRSDDVIKVSGHRIGTEEVESALLQHVAVAEAAVVPIAHEIKGQAICAFVSLKHGVKASESLRQELLKVVRDSIGGIAVPERIQWAHQLPKTRSGKIMRRILRKLAQGETQALGDLSTLADPSVVETLIQEMKT